MVILLFDEMGKIVLLIVYPMEPAGASGSFVHIPVIFVKGRKGIAKRMLPG
jgi:hypothetical protein